MVSARRPASFPRSRAIAVALLSLVAGAPADAQSLAVIVNGDPITTTEVEEQMKFRRVIGQPATRDAAVEDLIADRLKLRAANREGLDASDTGFAQALSQIATKSKKSAQQLMADIQRTKLNADLVRSHVRAVAAYNELVKSRYKALGVSDNEVTEALKKDSDLARAATDLTLQQIVLVVPVNATPATIEERMHEAQALRSRFLDCASGVPLARALPDVAVKPPVTKMLSTLSEGAKTALSQTEKGRLTPPQRSGTGIEMYAVCDRKDDGDRSTVRDTVQASLLTDRLAKEADRMYQELRARAVVERR